MLKRILRRFYEKQLALAIREVKLKCDSAGCGETYANGSIMFEDVEAAALNDGWTYRDQPAGESPVVNFYKENGRFLVSVNDLTFPRSHYCPFHSRIHEA